MTFPDGRHYSGLWAEGCKHGRGEFYWPRLKMRFEGNFRNNKKHGQATYYFQNGDILGTYFDDDAPVGSL